MQLPPLNVNMAVIAALVIGTVYGLIAGKQRLRILILSVYVGIVLASQLSDQLAHQLPMLEPMQVSWLLLGVPILIFGVAGIAHSKHHDRGAMIANLIVGMLTGALVVSSAINLLPTSTETWVNNESFVAMQLGQAHLWLLGLLPVVALIMGWMSGEKKSHH